MKYTIRFWLTAVCLFILFQPVAGFAQTEDSLEKVLAPVREKLRATRIELGVIVATITKGGAADQAGLQQGDLIVKVNDESVLGNSSFASIRDRLRGSLVTFTVWRAGGYVTSTETLLPATVGITGEEWSYSMSQILLRLEAGDVDTAGTLAQQAEAANLLSKRDSLVAKLLILPGGPPVSGSDQDKMTRELTEILSTPVEIGSTASRLQKHGRPWPAVPVRRKLVAALPNDVNHRLNLAQLLARLKQNDEAEENVRYIIEHRLSLNKHGFSVKENVLGTIAANRDQWSEAYDHDVSAVAYELQSTDGYTPAQAADAALRHVTFAAHLKDVEVFEKAAAFANTFGGKLFQDWRPFVDALHAFVLNVAGRKDEATRIVAAWKGKPAWQAVYDYWALEYLACAQNWKALAER